MSALNLDGPWSRPRRPRSWAIRAAVVAAAALLMALAFDRLGNGPDDAIHDAVSAGRPFPAPELDLELVTAGDLGDAPRGWWRVARDGRVSLSELRGRPVVINFWAPDCTPCHAEARALERAAQEAGRDVLVLGVGSASSSAATRDFVHALGLSFPQVHDRTGDAARLWGVDGVPETFFLRDDGHIVGHIVGAATSPLVREGVAAALTGRPAGLQRGGAREPLP
jgi:thiol-disulfide isomerase/thioredoxin